MGKLFSRIIILLISVLLISCSGKNTTQPVVKLIPVKSGDKYGFIDLEGKFVINPMFRQASIFRNGLALVQTSERDHKWGFIAEDGSYKIQPKYDTATTFNEDLAWVTIYGQSPMAINTNGEIKITLPNAEQVKIFTEGLAAYSLLVDGRDKWGFIDKDNIIKIEPQYLGVSSFHGGRCVVVNDEKKCGYIDIAGKLIINCQFDGAWDYSNGMAIVNFGGKYGVIDENGKYLINPQYSEIRTDKDMFLVKQDEKWGWVDTKGNVLINLQFSEAISFENNDLTSVQTGKLFGYIDKKGKISINPQFDAAYSFNGKLAVTCTNNRYGFINNEGKYQINPQFEEVSMDYQMFTTYGLTMYSQVRTGIFNINAITESINKIITNNSVAGMTFDMPMSVIPTKFNITDNEWGKLPFNPIVSREKLTNDADGWLLLFGPYISDRTAEGFVVTIGLHGNGEGKVWDVINAIKHSLTGYVIADENAERVLIKSDYQTISIQKGQGDTIVMMVMKLTR
jgi:hypothetical protein